MTSKCQYALVCIYAFQYIPTSYFDILTYDGSQIIIRRNILASILSDANMCWQVIINMVSYVGNFFSKFLTSLVGLANTCWRIYNNVPL